MTTIIDAIKMCEDKIKSGCQPTVDDHFLVY